jgi:hypothetical protein
VVWKPIAELSFNPTRRLEGTIRIDLGKIRCEDSKWIELKNIQNLHSSHFNTTE